MTDLSNAHHFMHMQILLACYTFNIELLKKTSNVAENFSYVYFSYLNEAAIHRRH